ncbi:MAG: hypothetical protein KBS72_02430 [Bacteroidales bacterium]|nr:hypothetical protein [Candidatus Cacconaster scatequi]
MRKDFIVAGHRFSIVMDDASPLWERMKANYGPFVAPTIGDNDGMPIFTLYVHEASSWSAADTSGMEALFVGVNSPEETQTDFYKDTDGFYLEFAVNGRSPKVASLRISDDFKSGALEFAGLNAGRFAIDNATMLMFAFSTAGMMTLEMHSSVTVNSGRAYMFLAESGTGKSTHSRMWLENISGSELLNDDNPIVRVDKDGSVTVYGSPWSGKTPCYRNASAPLGAMVQIRRSPTNAATPLSALEAYALISASSSGFRGITSMADGLHDTISAIALSQPCFVLDCRPDAEAAQVCHEAVCR